MMEPKYTGNNLLYKLNKLNQTICGEHYQLNLPTKDLNSKVSNVKKKIYILFLLRIYCRIGISIQKIMNWQLNN